MWLSLGSLAVFASLVGAISTHESPTILADTSTTKCLWESKTGRCTYNPLFTYRFPEPASDLDRLYLRAAAFYSICYSAPLSVNETLCLNTCFSLVSGGCQPCEWDNATNSCGMSQNTFLSLFVDGAVCTDALAWQYTQCFSIASDQLCKVTPGCYIVWLTAANTSLLAEATKNSSFILDANLDVDTGKSTCIPKSLTRDTYVRFALIYLNTSITTQLPYYGSCQLVQAFRFLDRVGPCNSYLENNNKTECVKDPTCNWLASDSNYKSYCYANISTTLAFQNLTRTRFTTQLLYLYEQCEAFVAESDCLQQLVHDYNPNILPNYYYNGAGLHQMCNYVLVIALLLTAVLVI